MKNNSTLLSVSGNISGDDCVCIIELEKPLWIRPGTTVGLQDVLLPSLFNTQNNKEILSDIDGGLIRVSIYSDLVSSDTILGDQLLRSFVVKAGQRHYESPYSIMLNTTTSTFHKITLHLKFKTCEGLGFSKYRGRISLNLVLDNPTE